MSHNDKKAAVVERFNRTLKTKISTYFTTKQPNVYIDKLEDFVKSSNHSLHRMFGMRPADVIEKDQDRILEKLYGNMPRPKKHSAVGKLARISKVKGFLKMALFQTGVRNIFIKGSGYKNGNRFIN